MYFYYGNIVENNQESFIIFNPIISSLFSANKTDTDLTDRLVKRWKEQGITVKRALNIQYGKYLLDQINSIVLLRRVYTRVACNKTICIVDFLNVNDSMPGASPFRYSKIIARNLILTKRSFIVRRADSHTNLSLSIAHMRMFSAIVYLLVKSFQFRQILFLYPY